MSSVPQSLGSVKSLADDGMDLLEMLATPTRRQMNGRGGAPELRGDQRRESNITV